MAGAPSLTASSGSSPAAAQPSVTAGSRLGNMGERARRGATVAVKHIVKHTGTGIVCSVAYFDP